MSKGRYFFERLRDLQESDPWTGSMFIKDVIANLSPETIRPERNTIWCLRGIGATISDAHLFSMKEENYNADDVNQKWHSYEKSQWNSGTIYSWIRDDMKDRYSDLENLFEKYPFFRLWGRHKRLMGELQPGAIEKGFQLLSVDRILNQKKRKQVLGCLRSLEIENERVHHFFQTTFVELYDYDQIETEFQKAEYVTKNNYVDTFLDWVKKDTSRNKFELFCEEFLLPPLAEKQKFLLFGTKDDFCQILYDIVGTDMIFVKPRGNGFYWDKNTKLYIQGDNLTMAYHAADYLKQEANELLTFLKAQYRGILPRIMHRKILLTILGKKRSKIEKIRKYFGSFNGPLNITRRRCIGYPFFQPDFQAKIGTQHLLFPIAGGKIFDIRLMSVRDRVQSDIFEFSSQVQFNPTQENLQIANEYFLKLANYDQELADYIRLFLGSCIIGTRPSESKGYLFILWGIHSDAKVELMHIMNLIMGRLFTILDLDKDGTPKPLHRMALYEHSSCAQSKLNLSGIPFQPHTSIVVTTSQKPKLADLVTRYEIKLIPFRLLTPLSRSRRLGNIARLYALQIEDLHPISSSILLAAGEFLKRGCQMPELPEEPEDSVTQFVNEICEISDDFHIGVNELRNEYLQFCETNLREKPLGRQKYNLKIRKILTDSVIEVSGFWHSGVEAKNIRKKRCWPGIKIKRK